MFGNTTRDKKQKAVTIQQLFFFLEGHIEPMVHSLADLVLHPETKESVFLFVVFCTG